MDIGFFISLDNKVVQLPINPPKVSVTYDGDSKSTEIVKLGEISLLRGRKLGKIEFESILPYDTWFPDIRTKGKFKKPEFYKEFFTTIMEKSTPCRLIITGIDINMLVSIEQFSFYHQAGDHEDAYFTMELKEYRPFTVKRLDKTPTKPNKPTVSVVKPDKNPTNKSKAITIGSTVILNGRVHYDSYGAKPGKSFTNYKGKVNFINKKGSHIYHITTLNGGWLGWVKANQVKLS